MCMHKLHRVFRQIYLEHYDISNLINDVPTIRKKNRNPQRRIVQTLGLCFVMFVLYFIFFFMSIKHISFELILIINFVSSKKKLAFFNHFIKSDLIEKNKQNKKDSRTNECAVFYFLF